MRTIDWVQQEVDTMRLRWQKIWGPITFSRVDAPYSVGFVISSPDGNEVLYDGQEALKRVRGLRHKFAI